MARPRTTRRYSQVAIAKADGVAYTPGQLADFVAHQIVGAATSLPQKRSIRVLDPAVGEGELLVSLVRAIRARWSGAIAVHGYDTDPDALNSACDRLRRSFPELTFHLAHGSFLDAVAEQGNSPAGGSSLPPEPPGRFDLVIANPPYVRTQVMGAERARELARRFGLAGRVDIYHAFLPAIGSVLEPDGVAGVIVSNRFMTTRSGEAVRRTILDGFAVNHVWDFGDTKLFDAAVLPAVLLLEGRRGRDALAPRFTSIYESQAGAVQHRAVDAVEAVEMEGLVEIGDGRRFLVKQGSLAGPGQGGSLWRVATESGDAWLAAVEANSRGRFRDVGKVRVGVKTCADRVFIGHDWGARCPDGIPELLRPLTTHHAARRFRAAEPERARKILYPHELAHGGRRAVDLREYPRSRSYLEGHRGVLEARTYVLEAGREWYEIWVPQDPGAWDRPKLVFRDIAEEPAFWLDLDRSVVNGDCYWLACDDPGDDDLLWLAAAVGNSTFIERYYDHRFNNKLYAGRRRFMTQYVEEFPLPDRSGAVAREIVANARRAYDLAGSEGAAAIASMLDGLVWRAFGLDAGAATGGE